MTDQKNTILAIVLSAIVVIGWQYFIGWPQVEKQRLEAQQKAQQQQQLEKQAQQPQVLPDGTTAPQLPGQGGAVTPAQQMTREAAIDASGPRIKIETPALQGSIALKGGKIDDLALVHYRETVDPKSPAVVLLSPNGAPHPFFADFGWFAPAGATTKLPDGNTVWQQQGGGSLGVNRPVTFVFDNGDGLEFRRTVSVDDKYMFTIQDSVANKGAAPVTLYPYARVSRHGTPETLGYIILHEGFIGVLDDKLQEKTYKEIVDKKSALEFTNTKGWLGFTDKYWAATLLPDPKVTLAKATFSATTVGTSVNYQADYFNEPQVVAPGATVGTDTKMFAGAKEVVVVDGYNETLGIKLFDRLVDWGYLPFITKPMFYAIDFFFKLFGNFGLAILAVTVVVKILFFPLANKSYASMAKMKAVQPELMAIRTRFPDDKMKQQQAMMELYKKQKINPLAGCLPIMVQIPVFFSLYKVLFITIEMRHAPFYGWIKDLSAPDPTNIFTLFGLIPFDPTVLPLIGQFLHVGIWPLIMGATMWAQMKLNPPPPDPTQKMIFDWMPLIFTFMLASFSAGLVIYWAWNNLLSVIQQSLIMRKHGAKIELFDSIKSIFVKKKTES